MDNKTLFVYALRNIQNNVESIGSDYRDITYTLGALTNTTSDRMTLRFLKEKAERDCACLVRDEAAINIQKERFRHDVNLMHKIDLFLIDIQSTNYNISKIIVQIDRLTSEMHTYADTTQRTDISRYLNDLHLRIVRMSDRVNTGKLPNHEFANSFFQKLFTSMSRLQVKINRDNEAVLFKQLYTQIINIKRTIMEIIRSRE